ncbi:hypothetical protein DES53_10465 [Roseimicrobium gellanilyticum]|uniref:Uncharacterized protein n=1 Tax=Roseimicrobium gellanilyticum TaxID=748857 RepID=A0A366HN94_9BACT|nr:hypothetical protein [Roseimicrobium gellanilyticum]RBP44246.1 hypothetical protein DES53_10465 [Roseimicrobium gellanilyticum]
MTGLTSTRDQAPRGSLKVHGVPWLRMKVGISLLLVAHFATMLLMVGTTEGGRYTAPPLLQKAAVPAMPYVRFLGVNSGYRFFAPDPGPATLIWARIERVDGSSEWVEYPSRTRQAWTMAYQRELYPAMLLGAQVAPSDLVVAPGRPRVTELGITYAMAFVRRLARLHGSADNRVAKVELFSVSHAIRTPQQVRSGWDAEDLRLYFPVSLGAFSPEGVPLDGVVRMGHERPGILEVAERMLRESSASGSVTQQAPDMPGALRRLLREHPELNAPGDERPLQERIGTAVMSRDVQH